MTKFLENEIYRKLDEGKILVFPTEESARGCAVEYTRSKNKCLLASQCISFDNFASLFFLHEKGEQESNDLDRLIFSEWLMEKHAEDLLFFYNENYPEMKSHMSSFIAGILTELKEALSEKIILDAKIKKDLILLYKEYNEYLKRNNLYENNYLENNASIDTSNYYLVASDAFPKEIKLERRLFDVNLNKINPEKVKGEMSVFSLEKEEIHSLFVSIRSLLDRGVGLEEIAISSSALKRLRPYIELEAMLFDIPLQMVAGEVVSDTLPGKFLSSILELHSNGYQIDDMKSFFLNPAMGFKDRKGIQEFISSAVRFSIASAPDWSKDRYSKLYIESDFSYRSFRKTLDRLMVEKQPDKCLYYFQELLNILFGPIRFADDEEDNNVFGFIQDNLKSFLTSVSRLGEHGYVLSSALFPIFIRYIKDANYVSRNKIKGIRVYPFGQGAATPYKYHFLISLNEGESKSLVKEASFLSEYERDGITDQDVTENLLSVYQAFNENIYLSTSRESYIGEVLPLVELMDSQKEEAFVASDSYFEEESAIRKNNTIYPLQKLGYQNGLKGSLRNSRRDEFRGKSYDSNPWLSFSSVDTYEKCHFKYALEYCFDLRALPLFDISNYDALEIGNRLHSIMERFERYGQGDNIEKLDDYMKAEMELWMEGKKFSFDQESGEESIIKMPSGSAIPTESTTIFLRKKFIDNMIKLCKQIRDESVFVEKGLELALKAELPEYGFNLTGRIDKLARSKTSGSFIVYDYKSGKKYTKREIDQKRLQFDIYNLLIEKILSERVESGKFVFLKEGEMSASWDFDPDKNQNALKRLMDASAGIKNGNWDRTNDKNMCSGCEFKGLCRRRMAIK